jgi:hypothetical protein
LIDSVDRFNFSFPDTIRTEFFDWLGNHGNCCHDRFQGIQADVLRDDLLSWPSHESTTTYINVCLIPKILSFIFYLLMTMTTIKLDDIFAVSLKYARMWDMCVRKASLLLWNLATDIL